MLGIFFCLIFISVWCTVRTTKGREESKFFSPNSKRKSPNHWHPHLSSSPSSTSSSSPLLLPSTSPPTASQTAINTSVFPSVRPPSTPRSSLPSDRHRFPSFLNWFHTAHWEAHRSPPFRPPPPPQRFPSLTLGFGFYFGMDVYVVFGFFFFVFLPWSIVALPQGPSPPLTAAQATTTPWLPPSPLFSGCTLVWFVGFFFFCFLPFCFWFFSILVFFSSCFGIFYVSNYMYEWLICSIEISWELNRENFLFFVVLFGMFLASFLGFLGWFCLYISCFPFFIVG